MLVALVNELLSRPELSLDPRRVFLTGTSMGGSGVWDVAARYPGLFAAAVICSGEGPKRVPPPEAAKALRQLPVWVWHAVNDVQAPVARTDQMVSLLHSAGAKRVQYSRLRYGPAPRVYPWVAGHAVWLVAFERLSPVWDWLLTQTADRRHAPSRQVGRRGKLPGAAKAMREERRLGATLD